MCSPASCRRAGLGALVLGATSIGEAGDLGRSRGSWSLVIRGSCGSWRQRKDDGKELRALGVLGEGGAACSGGGLGGLRHGAMA